MRPAIISSAVKSVSEPGPAGCAMSGATRAGPGSGRSLRSVSCPLLLLRCSSTATVLSHLENTTFGVSQRWKQTLSSGDAYVSLATNARRLRSDASADAPITRVLITEWWDNPAHVLDRIEHTLPASLG